MTGLAYPASAGTTRLRLLRVALAAARWFAARPGVSLLSGVWVVVVANFIPFDIVGDGERPFTFVRALFGETKTEDAYQFGLALFEVPFYGIAKLGSVTAASEAHTQSIEAGAVVLGLAALVLAGLLLLVPVLEGLGLPAGSFALGAALFGTPLFYYSALHPGNTHSLDAALYALLVLLIFLYFREDRPSPMLAVAMGTVVGVAFTVRYFSAALGLGLAIGLLCYRRRLHAVLVLAAACVAAGLLCLVALWVAGNPFAGAVPLAPSAPSTPSGPSGPGLWPAVQAALGKLAWEPANLPKMLFSTTHGLFVWTPITVIALFGFVRLLVRDRRHRPFLVVAGATGLAVVLSYAFSPFWTGAGGFSERYYTILFPLVAIGVASTIEWRRRLMVTAGCIATAWSLWLAFGVSYGWGYRGDVSTAFDSPVQVAHGSLHVSSLAHRIYCASKLRHATWSWTSCPAPDPPPSVFRDPGPAWVVPRSSS
jgi:hypothetical protein